MSVELSPQIREHILAFEGTPERPYVPLDRLGRPLGVSGITIGAGEDLGQKTRPQFTSLWVDSGLRPDYLLRLAAVCGFKGMAALERLPSVRDIRIPVTVSVNMFLAVSWPHWCAETERAFPGSSTQLSANAFGALVSLCYNRGPDVLAYDEFNPKSVRREEMANIRDYVVDGNQVAIALQLVSMAHWWKDVPGLVKRRLAEAALVDPPVVTHPDYIAALTWAA